MELCKGVHIPGDFLCFPEYAAHACFLRKEYLRELFFAKEADAGGKVGRQSFAGYEKK